MALYQIENKALFANRIYKRSFAVLSNHDLAYAIMERVLLKVNSDEQLAKDDNLRDFVVWLLTEWEIENARQYLIRLKKRNHSRRPPSQFLN